MSEYIVEVRTVILTSEHDLHAYLYITRPDGTSEAWGLYPATDNFGNLIYGPGDVRPESAPEQYTASSGPISMTDSQYQQLSSNIAAAVAAHPNYSAISLPGGVQCSTWAIEMLHQPGVDIVPSLISPSITPELIPILDTLIWNPILQSAGFKLWSLIQFNELITAAINWVPPRRDPLVLDLDGGGISTSGIDPSAPIYFDQDGDGMKVATGWIAAGEAIVVRDLDGNGTIDTGLELFGDNTVLQNGPGAGQLADNGFAALADLDADATGVADGKFDSDDVAFSGVRLWKDANQDAISQADELFTFDDLGVASINVSGTAGAIDLGGGNTQTFSGSFTRTDGQVGASGTAHMVGSLLLSNDNFYREFTDDPVWTTEAQNLPQMTGSGAVRDLRPAMSLGTAQALDLQGKVAQFAAGTR